jgi:hypothetical protein
LTWPRGRDGSAERRTRRPRRRRRECMYRRREWDSNPRAPCGASGFQVSRGSSGGISCLTLSSGVARGSGGRHPVSPLPMSPRPTPPGCRVPGRDCVYRGRSRQAAPAPGGRMMGADRSSTRRLSKAELVRAGNGSSRGPSGQRRHRAQARPRSATAPLRLRHHGASALGAERLSCTESAVREVIAANGGNRGAEGHQHALPGSG